MVLFTSLNTALSGLQANMAALQTIGHNISNASTPGFSRQTVDVESRQPQNLGFGQIGTGVSIQRIRRLVDLSLETRLRDASSGLGTLSTRTETLTQLESLFQALSENDLGGMMNRLFGAIEDWTAHPENLSARAQVLQNAQSLTRSINDIALRIRESRVLINNELQQGIEEVNRLTSELADLNRQVLLAENGGTDLGSANDLRDRRDILLRELSDYLRVQAVETSTGEINVLVGSSFVVFGQQSYELATDDTVDAGVLVSRPVFAAGTSSLDLTEGKLSGLIEARDEVLKGFLRELDILAHSSAYAFNRIQSTGMGLERFRDLTSTRSVGDATDVLAIDGMVSSPVVGSTLVDSSLAGMPDLTGRRVMMFSGGSVLETRTIEGFDSTTGMMILDEPFATPPQIGDRFQITDLPFALENGGFDIVLTNELTGISESFRITVDLDKSLAAGPVLTDETLSSITAQINAVSPFLSASLTATNQLRIQSSSTEVRFSFANDSSNFLAAIGLNSFFDGADAENLTVNRDLLQNPGRLSAGQSANPGDNAQAFLFGSLRAEDSYDGYTLDEIYQNLVGRLGVEKAESQHRLENQQMVIQQLQNQRDRVSGVNVDEEAVKMLQYQRAFQASARFIGVVDSLMEALLGAV